MAHAMISPPQSSPSSLPPPNNQLSVGTGGGCFLIRGARLQRDRLKDTDGGEGRTMTSGRRCWRRRNPADR
eukprot:5120169-Pyramimonas_sp.AAC.1